MASTFKSQARLMSRTGEKDEWQIGVDLIDQLLQPGSKTSAALSPTQARGMHKIRKLLVTSALEKRSTPQELMRLTGDDDDCVNDYLLTEFGGAKKSSIRAVGKRVCNTLSFLKITKGLVSLRSSQSLSHLPAKEDYKLYVPPEFLKLRPSLQHYVAELLDLDNLANWDYDAVRLSMATSGAPLLFIGWAIIGAPHAQRAMAAITGRDPPDIDEDEPNHYGFVDEFNFTPETLCNFMRAVEADYLPDNPYHNNIHAADVLQTTFSLLQMGGNRYSGGTLDIFSILVAAGCHDMGHPGKNNTYLVNSKSPLAVIYNDGSVLENMHAARAFRLLLSAPLEANLNITSKLSPNQFASFRTNFIKAILATDMSKHFQSLASLRATVNSIGIEDPSKFFTGENTSISQALLFIIHAADISNPAKPAPSFSEWADRCLDEFFAQGDAEKKQGLPISPMCCRQTTALCDSQIGFIKFIVMPTFKLVGDLVPNAGEDILPVLKDNLKYWEDRKANEANEDDFRI